MAEIGTAAVLDGVTLALRARWPKAGIYAEDVAQGLKGGDFIVLLISDVQSARGPGRYRRNLVFDVLYHPKRGRRECLAIGNELYLVLELIRLPSGDLLRGAGMRYEAIDGVLHFKVSFEYGAERASAAEPMETLDLRQEG